MFSKLVKKQLSAQSYSTQLEDDPSSPPTLFELIRNNFSYEMLRAYGIKPILNEDEILLEKIFEKMYCKKPLSDKEIKLFLADFKSAVIHSPDNSLHKMQGQVFIKTYSAIYPQPKPITLSKKQSSSSEKIPLLRNHSLYANNFTNSNRQKEKVSLISNCLEPKGRRTATDLTFDEFKFMLQVVLDKLQIAAEEIIQKGRAVSGSILDNDKIHYPKMLIIYEKMRGYETLTQEEEQMFLDLPKIVIRHYGRAESRERTYLIEHEDFIHFYSCLHLLLKPDPEKSSIVKSLGKL